MFGIFRFCIQEIRHIFNQNIVVISLAGKFQSRFKKNSTFVSAFAGCRVRTTKGLAGRRGQKNLASLFFMQTDKFIKNFLIGKTALYHFTIRINLFMPFSAFYQKFICYSAFNPHVVKIISTDSDICKKRSVIQGFF